MTRKSSVPFKVTRKQHASESAEDYTELVAELIAKHGVARTGEIARVFGVSHVTAVRTIQRLARDGFLITQPHQPVTLSRKGRKLAQHCRKRHDIVMRFLQRIGVPKEIAEIDAEGIEHHISAITLEKLEVMLMDVLEG